MNKDRNNNFGLLHFLAAIFVMYGHQFALLNRTSPIILGSLIQALGVKTIFLISGYFIGEGIKRKENNSFILYIFTRIKRLYPEYIV